MKAHVKILPLIEGHGKGNTQADDHQLAVALAVLGPMDHNGQRFEAVTPEGDKVKTLPQRDDKDRDQSQNICDQVPVGAIRIKVTKVELTAAQKEQQQKAAALVEKAKQAEAEAKKLEGDVAKKAAEQKKAETARIAAEQAASELEGK